MEQYPDYKILLERVVQRPVKISIFQILHIADKLQSAPFSASFAEQRLDSSAAQRLDVLLQPPKIHS